MKRLIFIVLFISSLLISYSQELANVELKTIDSKYFDFPRNVLVYTPHRYDERTEVDYDVIFVFDSQYRDRFDFVTALMHYTLQTGDENDREYIVVGVCSPTMPERGFNRNNDFLPMPEKMKMDPEYVYYGSSPEFKKFLKEELMPWLKANYRLTGHSLAIGHSLGASFVLDAMETDELFDDYIAMSPNFCWDMDRFANGFINYDFSKRGKPRFVYMTMGNEPQTWGQEWSDAWYRVKTYADSTDFPKGIVVRTEEFPDLSHNKVILSALIPALKEYINFRAVPVQSVDPTLYPLHIELTGKNLGGDVYVTGNQENLGNWNPQGIYMRAVNDSTRVVDLRVTMPVEFKFTKGSWETQIPVSNGEVGNQRIYSPERMDRHYKTY